MRGCDIPFWSNDHGFCLYFRQYLRLFILSRRLAARTVAAAALVLASGMPAMLLPAWGQDASAANAPAGGAGGMGKTPAAVSVLSIVEHPSLDALRDGLARRS